MDACTPDVSCDTSCGSEGSIACEDGTGTCTPPEELCSGLDDDCDGVCETALPGCRTPIHRGYGSRGHFYSSDLNRVSGSPYGLEANSYFYLYAEAGPSMRPLFLCHKGDDRYLLSTETACEIGVGPEQTLGFIAPTPLCGATPLYRLYKPEASNHFYTTSDAERDNAINSLGYLDEGFWDISGMRPSLAARLGEPARLYLDMLWLQHMQHGRCDVLWSRLDTGNKSLSPFSVAVVPQRIRSRQIPG